MCVSACKKESRTSVDTWRVFKNGHVASAFTSYTAISRYMSHGIGGHFTYPEKKEKKVGLMLTFLHLETFLMGSPVCREIFGHNRSVKISLFPTSNWRHVCDDLSFCFVNVRCIL